MFFRGSICRETIRQQQSLTRTVRIVYTSMTMWFRLIWFKPVRFNTYSTVLGILCQTVNMKWLKWPENISLDIIGTTAWLLWLINTSIRLAMNATQNMKVHFPGMSWLFFMIINIYALRKLLVLLHQFSRQSHNRLCAIHKT